MDHSHDNDDEGDGEDYSSLTSEAGGEYVFENGRRYHAYKRGRYMLPNDEHEMDRDDMKHHISMLITEGRSHLAPIAPHPERILDIGTGTGIWAIDMADAYPSTTVVATDLSLIQPVWVPPNLIIEIDDAEDDWLYKPNSFDFVHARYMFMGIRDWPRLVKQAMTALKPGGWVELVEMSIVPNSYDNSLPEPSQIKDFVEVLTSSAAMTGLDLEVASKFKGMLNDAGFEDVVEQVFDLPSGDWPQDRRMKEIGRYQRYQFTHGLQAICTALFMRVAGWSKERVEVFLAGVRRESNSKAVHVVYKLYFTYGRKPHVMRSSDGEGPQAVSSGDSGEGQPRQ